MNLCSDHHEEVCFEVRSCPLCEAKQEIETLKDEKESLEKQIEKLQENA